MKTDSGIIKNNNKFVREKITKIGKLISDFLQNYYITSHILGGGGNSNIRQPIDLLGFCYNSL